MSANASLAATSTTYSGPNIGCTHAVVASRKIFARIDPSAARDAVKAELLAAIPRLRALAISLTRHSDRADDLVQETLLKGWANLARYEPGTSMQAWLFSILRNTFYTQCRKKREVEDRDGRLAAALSTPARQNGHMDFEDFRAAAAQIPGEQQEALALVGGSGFSYREAAAVCGCPIGTVKSRISRARSRLAELLGLEARSKVQHIPRSQTSGRTDLTATECQHPADRRFLADDKARAVQVAHSALGDDPRHHRFRVVLPFPPVQVRRERENMGEVSWRAVARRSGASVIAAP
jgi:RNA polymerase sigma-70 factor, ECF subfamily